MIAFRLGRLGSFRLSSTIFSILTKPFLLFLFFFFLFSSTDLLYVYVLLFKVKLTQAIAFFVFLVFFFLFRSIYIPQKLFFFTLLALTSMFISTLDSPNRIANIGYIVFFLFNYLTYFSIPYNLFRWIHPDLLLEIYSASFFCMGFYALCQVVFSIFGVTLPGISQYIFSVARGQGFAYEPSFYALYMTPYAMFHTTKFILQEPSERKWKKIIWPNLLLLASTSTGCFFSYLFFIFFLALFKIFNILKNYKLTITKLLIKFSLVYSLLFVTLWFMNKKLIVAGFMKLFYAGSSPHFTVKLRWEGIMDYWKIFLEYPWFGLGLGSGPTYLLQQEMGEVDLLDPAVLHEKAPMNVTTEIMAGLGIVGSICFLIFFYVLFQSFRSTLKIVHLSKQERMNVIAFGISICVMFSTLQFSQSIMRPYMWIHIGLFMGYANYIKAKYVSSIKYV